MVVVVAADGVVDDLVIAGRHLFKRPLARLRLQVVTQNLGPFRPVGGIGVEVTDQPRVVRQLRTALASHLVAPVLEFAFEHLRELFLDIPLEVGEAKQVAIRERRHPILLRSPAAGVDHRPAR
jgi:hypothetical protein